MTPTITIFAGSTVRTKPRNATKVTKVALTEDITIPADKASLSLSPNSLRTILSFQFKGRRATIPLSRVVRNRK